jgi:hypothetical protein
VARCRGRAAPARFARRSFAAPYLRQYASVTSAPMLCDTMTSSRAPVLPARSIRFASWSANVVDRCERRAVRDRVDRRDARLHEVSREALPDTGVAQHAVDEQHWQRCRRGLRLPQQKAVEHHPLRRAGQRRYSRQTEPQRPSHADAHRRTAAASARSRRSRNRST